MAKKNWYKICVANYTIDALNQAHKTPWSLGLLDSQNLPLSRPVGCASKARWLPGCCTGSRARSPQPSRCLGQPRFSQRWWNQVEDATKDMKPDVEPVCIPVVILVVIQMEHIHSIGEYQKLDAFTTSSERTKACSRRRASNTASSLGCEVSMSRHWTIEAWTVMRNITQTWEEKENATYIYNIYKMYSNYYIM